MRAEVIEEPDFCYADHYIEKFKADGYKREENVKTKKLESKNRLNIARMEKRARIPQDIFATVSYVSSKPSEDNLSNTRYLKENVEKLIDSKSKKQIAYNKKLPNAKYRHLLIELEGTYEIYIGGNGEYIRSDNVQ